MFSLCCGILQIALAKKHDTSQEFDDTGQESDTRVSCSLAGARFCVIHFCLQEPVSADTICNILFDKLNTKTSIRFWDSQLW